MLRRTDISIRRPFARPALPGVGATMDSSDFPGTLPPSLLVKLVRRSDESTPSRWRGYPLLPRNLDLRLEVLLDPGVFAGARQRRPCDCCLRATRHARPFPMTSFSGLNSFNVGMTRYLYSSPCFMPTHQPPRCRNGCKAKYCARG